ncbi:MAG: phosphatidate cytidylyltransferase [Polyangiaceae bacterium]|jgi:phosphatidate cytidylyltransferase
MAARASNLGLRVATAAVGVPFILVLLYVAPAWAFYALVLPAALVGVHELFAMTHPGDHQTQAVGVLISAVASATVYFETSNPRALIAVLTLVPLAGPMATLCRLGALETAGLRACALGFGPLFVAVPLTLLAVMRRTLEPGVGAGAALLALGLAWFADTGAYFAGRFLGRHKLYEAVSPNKTIEGAFGGLFASVFWAVAASLSYLAGALPVEHAVILGLVAGALGQAGDLGESLLKRSMGVKDSGAIVPGHGGVLDRVDAVIVTAVIVYLYAQWAWGA